MKILKNNNLIYSTLAIVLFLIIALIYCSPVLSGNGIIQPDIVQHKGMAQEADQFQQTTGNNTYWSNAMFGGMPTYQTGAQYDFDWIKTLDRTLRFLPRPADYIFLLLGGFFILGIVLFKDWKYALAGAIFFAFCSYFFIIIAAGHNAKVHAIAYFAPIVAGVLLLYKGKYKAGFLLTTIFLGLELAANHPQMTYYLFICLVILAMVELLEAIKQKQILAYGKASALVAVAAIVAIGMNSSRILSTYEYSKESIRGKSEITLTDNNNSGLEKEYITQWSYGKLETLNLLIPNLMGGESHTNPEQTTNYNQTKRQLAQQTDAQFVDSIAQHALYWGDQPFTSGPAYQGAVVVFLFVLGLFFIGDKYRKYKWWLAAATLLSIFLAWGKNFAFFTNFFIDYIPLYDKFRAVSSILVIAEFTMPLMAILFVFVWLKEQNTAQHKKQKLLYVGGGFLVLMLGLYIFGGNVLGFESAADANLKQMVMSYLKQANPEQVGFVEAMINDLQQSIIKDRIALFKADALRSVLFVALAFGAILAHQYQVIQNKLVIVLLLAALAFTDGFSVAKRYFNNNNFGDKSFVNNPYPTQINNQMMRAAKKSPQLAGLLSKLNYNKTLADLKQQDSTVYRVYNTLFGTFNEANTSYFHHSIGGYHGAKLGRYQDVIDVYFSDDELAKKLGTNQSSEQILNMLNAKYAIGGDIQNPVVVPNTQAFGNAWLADSIVWVDHANDEMLALNNITQNKAILRTDLYPELKQNQYKKDTVSTIKLIHYQPNQLTYKVNLQSPKLAVFSEIFYDKGWVAYINQKPNQKEKEIKILKTNYLLRGLDLQQTGTYYIDFYFEPKTIQTTKYITLASNLFLLLMMFGGGIWVYKKQS